jgi:hypothetical protein
MSEMTVAELNENARIHRNPQNHHWLSWPLTGPDAIAQRFPVAGSLIVGGVTVLIAEGETCCVRSSVNACVAWKENVR